LTNITFANLLTRLDLLDDGAVSAGGAGVMSDASQPPGGGAPIQPRARLFGGRRTGPRSPSEALQPVAAPPPPEKPPRRTRGQGLSRLSALLSFVLIGAIAALLGVAWAVREAQQPGPLTADKVVMITRDDETDGAIADQLERAGVIDSPLWFNMTVLTDGNRGKLKRGEYLFKEKASLREVENELVAGKTLLHSLTIPEGLTSDQVVQRLRDNDVLVGDIRNPPREGSILPETYKFARGETRDALLTMMEKMQAKVVDEIWKRRAGDLPIRSPGELVTLASIVEKETGRADERPRVAGVFINRLQQRMKLQSDPTIVYGLVGGKGTLGRGILRSEVEQPTPYNTYVIDGLPPGPIANPGKAALEAVANPSRTKELYFVADGTGGHAFAETIDQHLKNVARWRQIEKDAKDRFTPDLPALPATSGAPAPKTTGGAPPASQKRTELAPLPRAFGELRAPVATPTQADPAMTARLAHLGADRQARASVMNKLAEPTRNLADLGIVVAGVNDQDADPDLTAQDPGAVPGGAIQSYPMSGAALAEQRAREARYGVAEAAAPQEAPLAYAAPSGAPPGARMASIDITAPALPPGAQQAAAAPAPPQRRAFDASEGTPLDPLLNKTWDLSYPKTVPPLR
jgi:UPF0755 protein